MKTRFFERQYQIISFFFLFFGDWRINKKDEEEKIKILKNLRYTNIRFIRIACHFNEVFKIEKYLKVLKKNKNINLFINIMQISEIDTKTIFKICNFSSLACLFVG